ncbi:phytoene desaturase family protein [Evansella cellulosilytica]|uniref:Phytoene desaturase n=1 Tax=Evansella cellulosilytica (strain ATCC 21833 / DSM 2522 / FERM P-1141 / JCM 9156 / N-4) TaxID=649639 RepID=E6TYI5_EVAC2|nr:phytoene desaturase family protein [Evansella cellulosilytica]ADU30035.1 phytoene desaturase [Evansella cellulosilytica DSM 2522]
METAIIGGGIGGLVTALYLQQQGDIVTVYERKEKLGGRLSFLQKDGYKVDEGPTIVLLPDMIKDILKEINIPLEKINLVKIDPMYPIHYRDGTTLMKWSNVKKQIEELERFFPNEVEQFKVYLQNMEERFSKGKSAFLEKSFVEDSFWTKENVKTLIQLKAYQTVRAQVNAYFTSEKLRDAFSLQTLYIGGAPQQTPAIYSLVPYSEHAHGIWYLNGGYATLVEILVSEMKKRNIKIERNSEVTEINAHEKNAYSLVVNGVEKKYGRFILNGDLPVARKLVKEKKQRKYVSSSGALLIYLGVKGKLTTGHVHQFFMGDALKNVMDNIFIQKQIPTNPAYYVFYPSLIDETLAPEGHGVAYVLVPVPANVNINREDYEVCAQHILKDMEKRLDENIMNKIVWKEIRTPHDAKQDRLFEGGAFGLAPTLFQSGVFRPQLKPFSYDNIYAVGASVHPGGGVPIVMQGAKLLAEYLSREKREVLKNEHK